MAKPDNQYIMKRLSLFFATLLIIGVPYFASAQTSDTTHTGADSAAAPAPHSGGWRTYRGESGSNRYRYNDLNNSNSDFKSHLMVGGALSLGYSTGEFLVGANPYVAYGFKPWIDAGVAINAQYYSLNESAIGGSGSYHNTLLGAGAFARVYPISFIFLQVQPEENEIWQKTLLDGQSTGKLSYHVFDFLVGGGIKFGPAGSNSWGFISLLFDVAGSTLSPYNGPNGVIEPILRVGYNVAL